MSTDELPKRFAVEFLSYESLKTRKRRIFLPTSYIQGQEVQEAEEAVESARAGLLQKRREKRKTKEGGLSPQEGDMEKKKRKEKDQGRREGGSAKAVPCVLKKEISFLVHEYLGSERPISVEVSAPTRLCLRGSHVRRKFRQRTTLRSKSST